ncbi:MAG: ATP synthase F0 subunit C [Bacilli bacterium]|nr:ATP synthase F0 subunit C [Bacilli bacterium]
MDAAEAAYKGKGAMAAGIAVLGGMACAIGEGLTTAKAVEAIGRNPECAGTVRSTMIVGCALVETTGIYALVISILLLFLVAI